MINIDKVLKLALDTGFTIASELDCSTIKPLKEVRDMCAVDKCNAYGRNWACPPGCGTLEDCENRIKEYNTGIIIQTVGELKDSFDSEGMMEIANKNNEMLIDLTKRLLEEDYKILPLGAGGCRHCEKCTCPDSPCRFPDKAISSMEAYGMLVSQVCKDNNVPYYHGEGTLSYTNCILIDAPSQ